jgi:hypothetical protein
VPPLREEHNPPDSERRRSTGLAREPAALGADLEALPNTTAMARADSLFIEVTGILRELLGQAIAVFRGALDAQDPDPIADARRRLLALVEDIEQGRMRPPG